MEYSKKIKVNQVTLYQIMTCVGCYCLPLVVFLLPLQAEKAIGPLVMSILFAPAASFLGVLMATLYSQSRKESLGIGVFLWLISLLLMLLITFA